MKENTKREKLETRKGGSVTTNPVPDSKPVEKPAVKQKETKDVTA